MTAGAGEPHDTRAPVTSAPGKLMLSGEYAVLYGAPALVAAVDRRVQAHWSDAPSQSAPISKEAEASRLHAEAALGRVDRALALDVSALRSGELKLGLGSSAAAAAAAAAAVYAWHGRSVAHERERLLEHAMAGHRAIAPEGSGADVAASVLGGFVHFERVSEVAFSATSLEVRTDLQVRVVWTGKEARTSDLVARVRRLGASHPTIQALTEAARRFVGAFAAGTADAVVEEAARYHDGMRALGQAADAPIVEERLDAVATLATRHGGAAKPSGAGGGDVAIAFFASEAAARAFGESCASEALNVLPLRLGVEGVRTS